MKEVNSIFQALYDNNTEFAEAVLDKYPNGSFFLENIGDDE